ncbi:unnamed protein product [Trichobilharzia szidati]|nr:unnamed protein product [Trichobilharzia szidati]
MTDSDGNEIGKLFIGGLSQATNNGSLRLYFSRFGEIDDAIVMMDNKTGRSRGFGYVKYHECESVTLALQAKPHIIDGKEVDAKQCNINMKGRNKRSLKIFVGGIGLEQDIESIKDYFKQFGHVTDVNLMMDTNKQRHRGFAFISFDDENVVKQLINLHYVNINNKQVEIKAMEPPNFNRKLINSNLINNSNNHNNNTSTITQNPCSLIPPHIYHLPNHTSNSDILNCHDIYESTTNDPAYNFLTNSFTPIYSAHSHPLFSYHPAPPHHHHHHHHQHQSGAAGLQPFLHPNTVRRYYCSDQQNMNTSATSVNTTTTTTTNTTGLSSNTNQFINNYNNFNSNLSTADQPFQSSPFIHQSFRTNPSVLRHPTDKSTTSTHSPLSHSTVTTTIGTATSNTTTPVLTGNSFSTMNGTQVTPRHQPQQQQYHHQQQSPMPLILTTTNQFQPNLFNFQQNSGSPSVYTIPCHFIPSHVIPFPSNSMIQQSTLMNIQPGLICNDVFNTTNTTTTSSGNSSATVSTVTDTTTNKKVMSNSSTEEQIISDDSLSRMTPVTTASKNMNTSSTLNIVTTCNNVTNTAINASLVATSTTTTLNETIDTTDSNNNVSNNAVATKSIDGDNFGILNNVQGDSITGEHITFCAPNYNHLNFASNSLQSTNLPLTSYYAFCSQYPTGVSNTPTGTTTNNLQAPTNDNYNVGQIINNVNGSSNPSISVTNQGDNPLTSSDNQSLTNDVLLADQKLNTTKCFCHPTIFIPNGINSPTQSINQTPNLWNTPGNISSNSLFHSTFQPLTGWNFPLGSSIISPPFTHQTSHYHPYIPQNQMTIHQNDVLNQWNQLPSTYSGNNNITKSTSNDINGNDLKDSIATTTSISSSSLLSSPVSSSTTLSPPLTTMSTVTATTKTESTEVPTTTILINSTTKSISPTSSMPTSDDVMTLNTEPKCNNKGIYLNDTMQNNFNKIMSAKPSGDNLEGLLVNNNNINQCVNDNIFCFIKSPITDLTSTLIEPENNEVTKSWQNNNNNNNNNNGLTNNLWNMPKVENLSQTLPTSSTLTTETMTLNYPTSPQMIIQPIYNSYHLSNEYVNGFLPNCDAQSSVNLNLTGGKESCSNVENNLNKLKLMNDNTTHLLSNNSMKTIINDNVKLPRKVVSKDNEKSSSPILSDINANSSSISLAPREKKSAIPEKVEMTENLSTCGDLSTNNIKGNGLHKNVIVGEECVDKTEQVHTKQFQNNNTDSTSTHLPSNEKEHEIDRGNISCIDKTYKEYECRSNTGATDDYPPNHHFVKNNYPHLL